MKRNQLVFIGILMLFVASIVLAEDQKKQISVDEAMKYFSITWINPAYYEIENEQYTGIKTMNKDGTFEFYKNKTSKTPLYVGTYKIEKSWVDKGGNVWLNVIFDEVALKKYYLVKISDDGSTLELDFGYKTYPTADSDTWPLWIMYRK